MEWIEITAKSIESAKELAIDELGISAEDAEFEVIEEPRTGLFGRVRGEARVRARVKPATVRQKQDRRGRRSASSQSATTAGPPPDEGGRQPSTAAGGQAAEETSRRRPRGRRDGTPAGDEGSGQMDRGGTMAQDDGDRAVVAVEDVSGAAVEFAQGLVTAFGFEATTSSEIDGNEIEVHIDAPDGLGLLIGPSGRTLLAIQDLARVAAQRRLGDHDTRLRIDVAGYRQRRRAALERFARDVAEQVKQSGVARSLEPMPSSDRKVIHDTLTTIDGVVSRSEGEDPYRRIIVSLAAPA